MQGTPRVVGKRKPAPAGQPPNQAARNAMASMARYTTRAPKGIFHYPNHEAANRDRERWLIEAMVARQAPGAKSLSEFTRPATWDDLKRVVIASTRPEHATS
jgi:hypothetical protein